MNDLVFLLQFAGVTILVVGPVLLINRLLEPAEGGTLANLFAIPLDPPWPRGMQEEEPTPWRVELLHRGAPTRTAPPSVQCEPMLSVTRPRTS